MAHPFLIFYDEMVKMIKQSRFILTILLVLSTLLTGCTPKEKTPLVVFGAGSLIVPLKAVETAFEKQHPDVDVLTEFHGSIQVLRHAAELNEPIDVVLSADHALIPMLMYTRNMPDTETPYADWYLKFATNKLTLAYTDQSRYGDEITADNWYEILGRDDVRIGLSDPRFDAAGYRMLMMLKLAEKHYQKENIFSGVFNGQFTEPLRDLDRENGTVILVPEILETKSGSKIFLRGSSIQLLSLLDSGDIDYAVEYESVVEQHGLKKVELPDAINMGSQANQATYESVEVRLDFQRFSTVEPEFKGEMIEYGLTIPANSPNPELAEEYIRFLLGPEGREIMTANHHSILDTVTADQLQNVPETLQEFISSGE